MNKAAAAAHSPFGGALKQARGLHGMSQLTLALEAGVSARHVSFIESGRARPSRPMVMRLAEALELPLRESNRLLNAAGYAALYRERGFEDADLAPARASSQFLGVWRMVGDVGALTGPLLTSIVFSIHS